MSAACALTAVEVARASVSTSPELRTDWRQVDMAESLGGSVGDRDGHFHARVNGAQDGDFAGIAQRHVRRGAGRLRAEIELVAGRAGHDVVGDVVVVDERERVALLDRDGAL